MGKSSLYSDRLEAVDWFAGLDRDARHRIEDQMEVVSFPEGAVICEEGDHGDWMFVVGEGEVAVVKRAADGPRIQVAVLRPGDFGGMMSLFEGTPRSASLEARTAVTLWTLKHDTFQHWLDEHPRVARGMLASMSREMRLNTTNLADTLHYVDVSGKRRLYEECSPEERLLLDTVNHKVASAESLDAIMNFLFESLRQVIACDRLSIAFLEDEGTRVAEHWSRATYEPMLLTKGYSARLRGSSLEAVIENGEPRILNDLKAYLKEHPASEATRLLTVEGIRSGLTCPLVVEGRALGFLFCSAKEPGAYGSHEAALLLAIRDRLAQAVAKAYRIERLTEANRAYFEMLGFVSHELKSPIASTVMDIELLLNGYLGDLAPQQHAKLERVTKKCHYLLDLVGEYLNLSRLESGELEANLQEGVDFIDTVVEPSIDLVSAHVDDRAMTLVRDWPEKPVDVQCAPDLLQIAVTNLLSNGVKYGDEGGEIRIGIDYGDEHFTVSVRNEGPGFPAEERKKLFRKFSRIGTPELLRQKGTGVGLYTTARIVHAHGGTIDARSEHGSWAEFTFRIPQGRSACRTVQSKSWRHDNERTDTDA